MPTTGSHLRITSFGSDALGVNLYGNPAQPEPDTFFVTFPGGRVEITRTTDNDYWVHVTSHQPNQSDGKRSDGRSLGRIIAARTDRVSADPTDEIEHIAVRVTCNEAKPSDLGNENEFDRLTVGVTRNLSTPALTDSPF